MTVLRGVGAVAGCVAAVVLVAACGNGDDGGGDDRPEVVVPTVTAPTVPVAEEPEVPAYPPGPEGDIDRAADQQGWVVADPSLYDSASAFVKDVCVSLPTSAADSSSRPQWLVESGQLGGTGEDMLLFGVPKLCPKWTSVVKQAASGRYDRWYGSGTFKVTASPAPWDPSTEEDPEIAPGTYRTAGDLEDCYWERTSKSGEILDNNFATSAQSITVTIREKDGQFTSRSCGTWKPVN
ncbi:hypothetical protein ACFQ6Q_00490 [Streptomyces sp. NPDC056437]|uniref:hypothetical protein n=1 Tax=Streptomyces sp. NPDC056437 TaxID=3345816 RepID=UPI003697FFDF